MMSGSLLRGILFLSLLVSAGCGSGAGGSQSASTTETIEPPTIEVPEEFPTELPPVVGDDAMIFGDWVCEEGSEQEIAFRQEEGVNVFQSYLEGRPMSTGTWQWDGNALSIEGTGGDYRFEHVSRFRDRLTLEDGQERWVCDLVLG